ncbi:MAG: DUF1804 family protein [Aliarcobacter butzleri]|uniref:DUF1804 family protein n=1 Tax=Aliarcobacter butzleri TaxID=28197 RepID=UPI00263C86F4|nr:DUF1804 family protein [Aliarcobacter butzleri]MDN5092702.1 DUF1804 family protein [Aliarcobacter butzleri]MDY0193715.1 DUF1804 family protein [Aliarcobacter butzleri]
MKKQLAKDMYIKENKSIEDICTSLGISRATFYYYKNRDKTQNQIDWDELKLINAYDKKPTVENEKVFLSILIKEFEKTLEEFKEDTAEDKLKKLERFASSYYRLKIPQNENAKKINKADLLKDFLRKIAQLAIDKGRADIVDFLSKNEDDLIEILIKE